MIYYRRNTVSDKLISFLAMMLAVMFIYNTIQMYQAFGTISVVDLLMSIVAISIGGMFLYTSKFKYIEITDKELTWYTWFFMKHTLKKEEIKDITTKRRYFIITKHKGMEVWISKAYINKKDDEAVHQGLKQLLEGK